MARVVCAGHVNWDVTLAVDALPDPDGEAAIEEQTQAAGGSAANTAAGLAGLGVETALLGSVGGDEHGHLARRELSGAGVDCTPLRTIPDGETTVKYLVVDGAGEVMVLANDGVNEAFAATDLDRDLLAGADHLHLTGQAPATAAALADRAAGAGLTVSVDPGRRVCDRDYGAAVDHADYLFLNGRELDCAESLRRVAPGVTVVTRGGDGASIRGDGSASHPGYDVDAVDTAGAGDAFAAGFLAAVLDGRDRATALSVGNACGALASRVAGARTDLSWEAVDRLRG